LAIQPAWLTKAIHAFADFGVHATIVDQGGGYLELGHDGGRDVFHGDEHVFISSHGCVQVEILDVGGHALCTGCGENAVEETLCCGEVSGFGADVALVVDSIATNSKADTSFVDLVGFVGGNDLQVGGLTALWNGRHRDAVDDIRAFEHVREVALGKTADFVGCCGHPLSTIRAVAKF
jgi:hypothetical protein